jgi:hypothetical protein
VGGPQTPFLEQKWGREKRIQFREAWRIWEKAFDWVSPTTTTRLPRYSIPNLKEPQESLGTSTSESWHWLFWQVLCTLKEMAFPLWSSFAHV